MRNDTGFEIGLLAKMTAMRELSDDFKLSYRSIAEVYESFGAMVARTATDPTIRFVGTKVQRNKKANRAAVLNAILLYLDEMPIEEQRRAIARGMARLNAMLLGEKEPEPDDDLVPKTARSIRAFAGRPPKELQPDEPDPAPARRRRRVKSSE